MSPRLLSLTAFLLKAGRAPPDVFTPPTLTESTWFGWSTNGVTPLGPGGPSTAGSILALPADRSGVVVALLDRPSPPPPWQPFIARALDDTLDTDRVERLSGDGFRSLGAAVFCPVEDEPDQRAGRRQRWVAFTFGIAAHAIRRQQVEPRFGLITALNRIAASTHRGSSSAVGQPHLRRAQHRALGPHLYQAGFRASADTPLDAFGMDRLLDMLSAAGGGATGSDGSTTQVYGGRSLKLRAPVDTMADLIPVAEAAVADHGHRRYAEQFGFVDQIVPVTDPAVEAAVAERAAELIAADQMLVDVLVPDDLLAADDERPIHYVCRPRERASAAAAVPDLTLDVVRPIVAEHGLGAEVRLLDADRELVARMPVRDCVAGELTLDDGAAYALHDGDLYQVDRSFLDRVNDAARAVEVVDADLLPYRGGPEAAWIAAVMADQPDRFLDLDQRTVHLDGETPFEPCDLLDLDGALIHAKRRGRSSSMSHLFVQAQRSCELLAAEPAARAQLADHVRQVATTTTTADRACGLVNSLADRGHEVRMILALLSPSASHDIAALPLLSKVTLLAAVRAITRTGLRPAVCFVAAG